jgi:FkbM family methyltransferase
MSNLAIPNVKGTLTFLASFLTPWRNVFRARAASGLFFHAHRRDGIGRHIAKYGAHEPVLTRWISDYLAAAGAGIVVDVGANLGWHALHAARHRNVATVIAFEPDKFNADLLRRNINENHVTTVKVDTRGVGRRREVKQLYRYKTSNLGRHSFAADAGFGSSPVEIIDLDSALAEQHLEARAILLLKIDVEGFESEVIAGASAALSRTTAIAIEHSERQSLVYETLLAAGFDPHTLRDDGVLLPLSEAQILAMSQFDAIWIRAK